MKATDIVALNLGLLVDKKQNEQTLKLIMFVVIMLVINILFWTDLEKLFKISDRKPEAQVFFSEKIWN